MWSRSSSNDGKPPSAGGENRATQPTCICAVGVSTDRNDASRPDRRVQPISTDSRTHEGFMKTREAAIRGQLFYAWAQIGTLVPGGCREAPGSAHVAREQEDCMAILTDDMKRVVREQRLRFY